MRVVSNRRDTKRISREARDTLEAVWPELEAMEQFATKLLIGGVLGSDRDVDAINHLRRRVKYYRTRRTNERKETRW